MIRYHRRDALDALHRAFPEKTGEEIRGIVNRMYANLGMTAIESLRMGRLTEEAMRRDVVWHNEDRFRNAFEAGKGVLTLNAHIGNWEMLCTLTPRFGYPVNVVVKPIKSRSVDAYIKSIRSQFGLQLLPSRNVYRDCLRALKRNEALGFILDQNMIRDEGVFVEFFGRPACTSPGLAYLAAHTGAPILPVFSIRGDNGKHDIHVFPELPPPADREPESIREATQVYTRVIEDMIRKYPDQWIWIHRRWRTKPTP